MKSYSEETFFFILFFFKIIACLFIKAVELYGKITFNNSQTDRDIPSVISAHMNEPQWVAQCSALLLPSSGQKLEVLKQSLRRSGVFKKNIFDIFSWLSLSMCGETRGGKFIFLKENIHIHVYKYTYAYTTR